MTNKNKISYVALSADILHEGHINILKIASKYGKVIVGLLTDKAIVSYKNLPYLNFNQRLIVVKNIKYVYKVVPQNTLDHTENLIRIKPDYVIHGDDWKKGPQAEGRNKLITIMKSWKGKVLDVPDTKGISTTKIKAKR